MPSDEVLAQEAEKAATFRLPSPSEEAKLRSLLVEVTASLRLFNPLAFDREHALRVRRDLLCQLEREEPWLLDASLKRLQELCK